jgi:hypothetical protein
MKRNKPTILSGHKTSKTNMRKETMMKKLIINKLVLLLVLGLFIHTAGVAAFQFGGYV